jgi:predicted MFS family arabinose efflux permease
MTSKEVARPPGRPEQWATRIIFFLAGIGMAAWAPLVPYAKARAGLDEGLLGVLLLGLGLGSMGTMPIVGAVAARFGCRAVIAGGALLIAVALPLLATLTNFAGLMAALMVFGAGCGAVDVAMNLQAILVERASGRAMMSGFHALFSVGGIAGAAGMAGLLNAGVAPLAAVGWVVGLLMVALAAAWTYLLTYGARGGPLFAVPRGVVLLIGALCFVSFLAEGAMLDWSAVFLSGVHGVAAASAGLGYAVFACAMTLGRFTGDRVVQRFGGKRVLTGGALCAGAGLAFAVLAPGGHAALAGFALVGLGCSNIVPVLFSSAGRQTAMPEALALPAVTAMGYAGILAGPALIGFGAHLAGLSAALLVLALALGGVALVARGLKV